jgi:hypothetical protein
MKHTLILALYLSLFLACDNKDPQDLPYPISVIVRGIKIQSDLSTVPKDELTIENAVINENILKLTVRYGGGCGTTRFELFTDGAFMESNPVQTNITLSFKDEDLCKALLTQELTFDLSKLATLYCNSYQQPTGTIILHIGDWPDSITYSF